MKTIYVDFDGVIHSYVSEFTEAHEINDPPLPGALKWLEGLVDQFHVFIYSTRLVHGAEVERAIVDWLVKHGMSMYQVDKLGFTAVKRGASVYIDDRCWRYEGGAYPTTQELQDFKPWNKR
jgi:hypothetical protein